MNILRTAIEAGLKFKLKYEDKIDKELIPDNTFGIFVAVERSPYQKLTSWPEDVHGCIGYWDKNYNDMDKNEIIKYVKKRAYDSTWTDSRRNYFPHSLYTDLYAKYKIYYMLLPIMEINNATGKIEKINELFDNKKYGLIIDGGATYLPDVFPDKDWNYIKTSLMGKSGSDPDANLKFYAYDCKIIEMTIIDYLIGPIVNWLNNEIIVNKNKYVRNVATMYDFLRLEKYNFKLNDRVKNNIRDNLNYYKNKFFVLNKENRRASAFLMIALYELDKQDPFINTIYDFLLNELKNDITELYDYSKDKHFEYYEVLMAITIVNKNNVNIKNYYDNLSDNLLDNKSDDDKSSIFRYNRLAKFLQSYLINKNTLTDDDIKKTNTFIEKIINYIKSHILTDEITEINYLAVSFEALTALYSILAIHNNNKNNNTTIKEIENIIDQLMIKLDKRKNNDGLYLSTDSKIQLDIIGHVLNGYYNLIPHNFIKKSNMIGGYHNKYRTMKKKYIESLLLFKNKMK